jgi:replication-associated recombination protein RarA
MNSNPDEYLFVEKYRPKTVEECILPENLKKLFQEFVNQKNVPNLLLSGSAGCGKTTVAKAMLEQLGCDYIVINGDRIRVLAESNPANLPWKELEVDVVHECTGLFTTN